MNGRYLLDTNIIIALLSGDPGVISNLDKAQQVFIPAVALGELYFGASRSGRPTENMARIDRFALGSFIVHCDSAVAREYGVLKQHLKAKGRPIPDNDIWIAAIATAHRMVLVTHDLHFNEVDALSLTDWLI